MGIMVILKDKFTKRYLRGFAMNEEGKDEGARKKG